MKWPAPCKFEFLDADGKLHSHSVNPSLDLVDHLFGDIFMRQDDKNTTLTMSFSTEEYPPKKWSLGTVTTIEMAIVEDLEFDGFSVECIRESRFGSARSVPYKWKLAITDTTI